MKRRIGVKLLLSNLLSTSFILIFVFLLTSYSFRDVILSKILDKIIENSRDAQIYVMNRIKAYKYKEATEKLIQLAPFISNYLSSKYDVRVQIFDGKKDLLADSFPVKKYYTYLDIHYAESGMKNYIIRKDGKNETIFLSSPIYYENEPIGVIRFIYPLTGDLLIVEKVKIMLLGISGISVILIVLANMALTSEIVRPIKLLKRSVDKLRRGIFDSKVQIKSNDEIEDLANAFNEMSQKLKEYINSLKEEREKQKNFTDNVTHELKTPISIILGHAELLKKIESLEDRRKAENYIISESKKLLKQVEQLLYVSKLNKPSFELLKTENDIALSVQSCVELLRPRFEKFSISVSIDVEHKKMLFDSEKIKEVLLNILDNAIKHSNCSSVKICGRFRAKSYVLKIHDNGKGMDSHFIERIREKDSFAFYDRNFGLGLKISKMIMEKHGGALYLESKKGKGTIVTMVMNS